uniref:receptor-like cytosolic serine/threonine-protein kinase RBK1 isoform X3 n=1 Tax=Fragaria vesca subsp. vesca TaxID=101020 RepID=UPI0005CA8183|nr:PREDICTED: receptor-like cytosolic serine/threonine-protein kinase RBK1 isoform X3 [Fragaria vesca subsp. vesca]
MKFKDFKKHKKSDKKKNVVLVGIKIDGQSRELLGWALAEAAEAGDCVIAVHVCRSSDQSVKEKPIVDSYVEAYEGLCNIKKVHLTSQVLTGSSIRKALVKEAKNHETMAVVVGTGNSSTEGRGKDSTAKYCAKKLPPGTDVVAINKGEVVYRRSTSYEQSVSVMVGLAVDESRPSMSQIYNSLPRIKSQSEFGDSEAETETDKSFSDKAQSSQASSMCGNEDLKKENKRAHNRSASSLSIGESAEKCLGWPLRRASSMSTQIPGTRNISVVQWVMSLPDRSPQQSPRFSIIRETSFEGGIESTSALDELPNELKSLLETNRCRWFSHEVLKTATTNFSSENLIGKGGCNLVFKGILPDGKKVAVKLMKSSKAKMKDFTHEVDIISSLTHEYIMPLLGFCSEENILISIYDFSPKGSLEENLHGKNKGKPVLSWEVRFKAALGIAEALNYLHNECSPPVIHRDVKSSNILLMPELEPRLSDFGLAIWGPTTTSSLTECTVEGTFGYLAPEYFMYGKISDKIDVYAFGVVLLELLSGRKPIGSDTDKQQESLVMWAKPKLENGDIHDILDPNFDGKLDEIQVLRMVYAAKLCIIRSARLRPKMSQIVNLLKGDQDVEMYVNPPYFDVEDTENRDDNDDEVYPNSSAELHLNLALLDVDDNTTSFSSVEHSTRSWEEYLEGRWSRSSSFD